MKILLCETDISLGKKICDALELENYGVDWIATGILSWNDVAVKKYDCFILDLATPKNGCKLCNHLRKFGGKKPVIMISRSHLIDDKQKGMRACAVNCLTDHFSIEDLMLRVHAIQDRKTN